jgi:Sortase domain
MSLTSSRRRVAVALAAALLAGAGTTWATRPDATASPAQTRQPAPTPQAALTAPGDPDRTLLPAGSPGAPSNDGTTRSPGTVPSPAAPGQADTNPAGPSTLAIARIGVRMTILPTGVAPDGQMALPPNPAEVGWYRYGPRPGDGNGATVLAAHIDSAQYGIGPLARLGELGAGDVVTVQSGRSSQRYVVSSTRQLGKSSLDLASIFARTGPPRLHLITCGGDYDRQSRHYEQNIIVLALPAP